MSAKRPVLLLAGSALLLAIAMAGKAPAQKPTPTTADIQGQRLFLRCASCHAISDTTQAKIGPSLHGVVGRKAGSLSGYSYSPAMKAQTFFWDEKMLDLWLTQPSAVVPGTSMAFAGLTKPEDRQAIIAYLKKAGRAAQ